MTAAAPAASAAALQTGTVRLRAEAPSRVASRVAEAVADRAGDMDHAGHRTWLAPAGGAVLRAVRTASGAAAAVSAWAFG
eukprot:4216356-Pleurochrysis_carterae.AAC.1